MTSNRPTTNKYARLYFRTGMLVGCVYVILRIFTRFFFITEFGVIRTLFLETGPGIHYSFVICALFKYSMENEFTSVAQIWVLQILSNQIFRCKSKLLFPSILYWDRALNFILCSMFLLSLWLLSKSTQLIFVLFSTY